MGPGQFPTYEFFSFRNKHSTEKCQINPLNSCKAPEADKPGRTARSQTDDKPHKSVITEHQACQYATYDVEHV